MPHDWDGLDVRGVRGITVMEVARLSPLHSHLLAGLGCGENSETETEAARPETRHQDWQDGAD